MPRKSPSGPVARKAELSPRRRSFETYALYLGVVIAFAYVVRVGIYSVKPSPDTPLPTVQQQAPPPVLSEPPKQAQPKQQPPAEEASREQKVYKQSVTVQVNEDTQSPDTRPAPKPDPKLIPVRVAGTGLEGHEPEYLQHPRDIFIVNRQLYISDRDNHRVQMWKLGASAGVTVAGGTGPGPELNRLFLPAGIFVTSSLDLYVADRANHRVMLWPHGATEGTVVAGGVGEGSALNQLAWPSGIYVTEDRTLYIADTDNRRILRWPLGASEGEVVAGGNGAGSNLNQLQMAWSVLVTPRGDIVVSDAENHRVVAWPPGSKPWDDPLVVAGAGGKGAGIGQLQFPRQMYAQQRSDGSYALFIADDYNHRVLRVSWHPGVALSPHTIVVAGGRGAGNAPSQLSRPHGVYAYEGNLFIADFHNHRILRIPLPADS